MSPRIEHLAERKVILHVGDCLDVMGELAPNSIDSCVTDPPYGLEFMGKSWDSFKTGRAAKYISGGKLHDPEDRRGKGGAGPTYTSRPAKRCRKCGRQAWSGSPCTCQQPDWEIDHSPLYSFQAFSEAWAREVFRVLKPGAHLLSFGGTRTYHRMVCAIEDAGFEIRDSLQWLYGSGFPKSHDVSKGIDRAAGAERPILGQYIAPDGNPRGIDRGIQGGNFANGHADYVAEKLVTGAATDAAREWQGWGTALKPACEPIVLARKPLSESTVAANVLKWGTGALNIDACRVGVRERPKITDPKRTSNTYGEIDSPGGKLLPDSRWPANVIHDGSDEVVGAFPESQSQVGNKGTDLGIQGGKFAAGERGERRDKISGFEDSGSAARFFYQVKSDVRCDLCSVNIAVSGSPRIESTLTAGSVLSGAVGSPPPGSAVNELQSSGTASNAEHRSKRCHPPNGASAASSAETWPLSRIVQNVADAACLCVSCATDIAHALAEVRRTGSAVPVHFSRSTSSFRERTLSRSLASYVAQRESTDTILTTTNLSELFGCVFHAIAEHTSSERSAANTEFASKRLFYSSKADSDDRLGSKHPTVKPLDLMQYLVRLVTKPGTTVLDPFAGTGTTGEAAFREGMHTILIEREPEYQEDIRRRMALVMAGPEERSRESIKAKTKDKPVDHGPLFGGTTPPAAPADRFTDTTPIRTNDWTNRAQVVNE